MNVVAFGYEEQTVVGTEVVIDVDVGETVETQHHCIIQHNIQRNIIKTTFNA
jgi:hypothetical protein